MSYKVPFVDPGKNYQMIRDEIDAVYREVMTNGDLIDRHHLTEFEENLADFVGTEYAIGLNSGYDALHLSLRALGIGEGDEVIVPAHTFVATASAVVNVGAEPVLVDIRKDFNIDPAAVEEAITDDTEALLPVHLNGRMADMRRIIDIAEDHDLHVVEDACQSLGSSLGDMSAGAVGDTGCWSFYPFKILGGYGDGGAITTDDPEIARYATRMRFNGEDRETGEYHGHGFTCLMDNIQAAWLDVKLSHLPAWIERRKEIAQRYHEGLSGLPGLELPRYEDDEFDHVYQNYVVLADAGDAFSDHMEDNGVEVLVQWRKPYYEHEALELEDRGFPVTEAISQKVCSLPMNVELEDEQVDYVIQAATDFFSKQ